jgi:hypothetical protein
MRTLSKSSNPPSSNWKRQANRRNAEKSTGPRTPDGKQASSRNATTHGLFCHALVLDGEDPALLHHLRQEHIRSLKPQDLLELSLVDRIVAHTWKLRRLQESEQRLHARQERSLRLYHRNIAESLGFTLEDQDSRVPASATLAGGFLNADNAFERLSLLAQRLENAIQRCLGQLRKLRADHEKLAKLPDSPFLNEPMPTPQPPHPTDASRGDQPDVQKSSPSSQTTNQSHGALGKMQARMLRAIGLTPEEAEQLRREGAPPALPPTLPPAPPPTPTPASAPAQEQTPQPVPRGLEQLDGFDVT